MTKVSYEVGLEEITSYQAAVARSKELGLRMITKYTPVETIKEVDHARLEKVKKFFEEKRKEVA